VSTGNLRDSIKLATTKPKQGDTLVAAGLVLVNKARKGRVTTEQRSTGAQKDPYYWRFVEFGTVSQEARPFLRPAMDPRANEVLEGLATELRKGIERAVKKGGKR
jgi:HK97 gp10 family phage protein